MVKLFEAFGEALGIHLSSYKGSVGMIVVEVDRSFLLALLWVFASELLVEEVCRDVVDVDKINTSLTNHLDTIDRRCRYAAQSFRWATHCVA